MFEYNEKNLFNLWQDYKRLGNKLGGRYSSFVGSSSRMTIASPFATVAFHSLVHLLFEYLFSPSLGPLFQSRTNPQRRSWSKVAYYPLSHLASKTLKYKEERRKPQKEVEKDTRPLKPKRRKKNLLSKLKKINSIVYTNPITPQTLKLKI